MLNTLKMLVGLLHRYRYGHLVPCALFLVITSMLTISCSNRSNTNSDIDWSSKQLLVDSLAYVIESASGHVMTSLVDEFGVPRVPLIEENNTSIVWLHLIGKEYCYNRKLVLSTDYLEQAFALIDQIDEKIEHDLVLYLLHIYRMTGNNARRLETLDKYIAKIDLNALPDSLSAFIQLEASFHYQYLDSAHLSQKYLDAALERISNTNDSTLMLHAKLREFYLNEQKMNLDQAMSHLLSFKELANSSLQDDIALKFQSNYWNVLGCYHYAKNDLYSTKRTILREIKCLQNLSNKSTRRKRIGLSMAFVSLANIESEQQNYYEALDYLDLAQQSDSSESNFAVNRSVTWKKIEIYNKLGYNIDSTKQVFDEFAFDVQDQYLERTTEENKSLKENNNRSRKLYEEKVVLESQHLSQQRDRAYLTSLILLLSLCFAFFYLRENRLRIRRENDLVKTKSRLLRGQLTPHFIHNSLHAIMLSIEDTNPVAYEYLSGLSKLLRHAFKSYQKDKILLSAEIDMLKKYVKLEQMRKKDGLLSLQVDVCPDVDAQKTLIMPMLIQPILENAIKHSKPKQKNQIRISIEHHKQSILKCTISDTGQGIPEVLTTFPEEHSLYYIDRHTSRLAKGNGLSLEPIAEGIGTRAILFLEYSLANN